MNKILTIFILVVILLQTANINAQYNNISFQNISYAEGLPHSSVNDIFQDERGFMWFATGNGLCKYDGYDFTVFQNEIDNPLSISSNIMMHIQSDTSDNILCILGVRSIIHYNTLTEKFTPYPNNKRFIFSRLAVDNNNSIWANGEFSVEKRTLYPDSISTTPISYYLKSQVSNLQIDKAGSLLVASFDGLYYFNSDSNKLCRHPLVDTSKVNAVFSMYDDNSSSLWLGTPNGLVEINNNKMNTYPLVDMLNGSHKKISCIVEDKNKMLWIGTGKNGVYVFDKSKKQFIAHYTQGDKSNLSDNEISTIFIDKFNNIWIATINGGLNKVSLNKKAFRTYQVLNKHAVVLALFEDSDENIWVGTVNNGLYVYDKIMNLKKHYPSGDSPNSIRGGKIASIVEDVDKNIWVTTWDGHLNKVIYKTGKLKVFKGGYNDLNGWAFRTSVMCKGGVLLGSLDVGLELFDPITEESKILNPLKYKIRVTSLYHNNDTLWIGTSQNAIEYNLSNKSSKLLMESDANATQRFLTMAFSDVVDNTIWIGTEGGGFKKIDLATSKVTRYTKADGLPDNSIYGLHRDNEGHLWMSTNSGISKFNIQTSSFTNYTTSDGIQSNEFKWGAHCKCKNGDIIFGGINGFTKFTPSLIQNNKYPPNVAITDCKLFNKSIHAGDTINSRVLINKNIVYSDTLLLNYNENDIAFGFASLHYVNPKKNMYMYMLKGYDMYWIETGADSRTAHYTNLDPGEYTFMVKSSNSDNVWSTNDEKVFIKIYPPWWGTLLFKITSILMVMFSLYSIYKIRISAIKKINVKLERNVKERTTEITKQKEELKKVNATKDKFFSIIAHDLKNPFYAISSLSELLKEQLPSISDMEKVEYIDLIHQSSSGATDLLENLLQWANTQSDKIEFSPELFDINEITNSCIMLMQVNAKNKNIVLQNDVPIGNMVFADRQMITTTIRNLLSNAIKFTPDGGAIKIDTRENKPNLEIHIEDNGVGMSEDVISKLFRIDKSQSSDGTSGEKGTGLGLLLCYEFVEKNSGSIRVESEKGKGSTFIISLPLTADK